MCAQEVRNEIIRQNVPKLIKELTGFKNDDENIRRCEQFAWSIIRNHRNLSTNSHEVRRKIEGIKEKFEVDNFPEYAQHLDRLCGEILRHPLCVEHYEVDVHWSLLDLLLSLAYNPTGALRRNRHKIDLNPPTTEEKITELNPDIEYFKKVLKDDFISDKNSNHSDTELSDWSDDITEEQLKTSSDCTINTRAHSFFSTTNFSELPNIKPPERAQPYVNFDTGRSSERLLNTVQHSWWRQDGTNSHPQVPIDSKRVEANFAVIYNCFLSETSNNFIRLQKPTTATEQCLIRELVWMFHSPQDCKFFIVSENSIRMRENVSVPSVTVHGLLNFIEQHFLPYILMMHVLRNFLDSIYEYKNFTPSNTLECYAANLRILLQPIWRTLLDYESRLLSQRDFEINTIINMLDNVQSTFKQIECIHSLHRQVVLNLEKYPSHISSVYLLASLMHCNQIASNSTEANLAMSLFLASVKAFCAIVDTWWTEGRLDDWQHEFVVERSRSGDQSIFVRRYYKNREKSFFVPTKVSKLITENSFFLLLVEHSLEAGCTLNLLYEINRIGDLRNKSDVIEGKLYNVFIEEVMKYVNTLQSTVKLDDFGVQTDDSGFVNETEVVDSAENELLIKSLTTSDEFLLLAFSSNVKSIDKCDAPYIEQEKCPSDYNALYILELLERNKTILPLEEVVLRSLKRIFKKRIAFANSFVMQLYREEFGILRHLQNIRKVLLFESSDLMYQFYDKLFNQIESGQSWANPFILTMQLDDIISSKYPELSSLFRVEVNSTFRCHTRKVCEAVDELTVTYNTSRELSHIITQNDIKDYNKVFRFLLKVKWAIMTLQILPFPRSHKRRIPYAPFEMVDLIMRRLEQIRFWMIYSLQNIHSHLMTHVLQSMGTQLDNKITTCTNLKEMQTVHRSFVNTVCQHCFLIGSLKPIKMGVEQLVNLTYIIRSEWTSAVKYIENNNPLSLDINESSSDDDADYVANTQVDAIEVTYVRCHQYLANKLNKQVYFKHKAFLSGLSAVFNTSVPH